jgi:outer membrane protein OmpA-like peptidoglycan-associated protein
MVSKAMLESGRYGVEMTAFAATASATYPPVYFDYRQWSLLPASKKVLDRLIKDMNASPAMRIEVRAYTDCRGDISSNMQLSQNRLKSVVEYLRAGINNPDRVMGDGYGESILVNDCACEGNTRSSCNETGHKLNRRAEFIVISSK